MRWIVGRRIAAVCGSALVAAASAGAGEPQFSPALEPCLAKAGGVTAAMVDCAGAETKVQDARLNDAYRQAMAKLTPARQKELQAVQRLWIQFRDANCKFAFDPDGGTMAQVEASGCVMTMTAERAQELEALAER